MKNCIIMSSVVMELNKTICLRQCCTEDSSVTVYVMLLSIKRGMQMDQCISPREVKRHGYFWGKGVRFRSFIVSIRTTALNIYSVRGACDDCGKRELLNLSVDCLGV